MTVTIDSVKEKPGRLYQPASLENTQPAVDFDSLFQAYWSKVHTLLANLLGDPDEAEDLALEVFWRLYKQVPKINEIQNIAGWIYRVATNLGYNALRSRKRRQHYEESARFDLLDSESNENPALQAEKAEQRHQIRLVLSQMRPRSAQILILRYSGLSYAEVAAAMDLSPSSIGTLLARAEQEFEDRYQKMERGRT